MEPEHRVAGHNPKPKNCCLRPPNKRHGLGCPQTRLWGSEQANLNQVSGVSGTVTCSRGASKTLAAPGPLLPAAASRSCSCRRRLRCEQKLQRSAARVPRSPGTHGGRGIPRYPLQASPDPTRSPSPSPGSWEHLAVSKRAGADREAARWGKGMEVEKPQLSGGKGERIFPCLAGPCCAKLAVEQAPARPSRILPRGSRGWEEGLDEAQ